MVSLPESAQKMKVEIITIGDEILIGQILDSNAAWMAQKLNDIGANVKRITTIGDGQDEIIATIREAEKRADIVLITGGLGPTKDDVTKKALANLFSCGFTFYPEIEAHITQLFARFGKEMTDINRLQAELPSACQPLQNDLGTAPGMWFERNNTVIISMPGVPYEMKGLMQNRVLPQLAANFNAPTILHRTILTMGMGESWLSEKIAHWEDALPQEIKLAYLPSIGRVRLRLSATGKNANRLQVTLKEEEDKLHKLIPELIFGYENDTMQSVVGNLLREAKKTVSTAESCTGGMIAQLLTSVSGSSDYYTGSVVAYSNKVKIEKLGVSQKSINEHGAVSESVVRQMADGIRASMNTDFGIATSGIAGPNGGTNDKPVGIVWIAIASSNGTISKKFQFGHTRKRNIEMSAATALNLLRKTLLKGKTK